MQVLLNVLRSHTLAYRAMKEQPGCAGLEIGLVHHQIEFMPRSREHWWVKRLSWWTTYVLPAPMTCTCGVVRDSFWGPESPKFAYQAIRSKMTTRTLLPTGHVMERCTLGDSYIPHVLRKLMGRVD